MTRTRSLKYDENVLLDFRRILSERGAFDYLAVRLGEQVPADMINSEKGKAPFANPKYLLGSKEQVKKEIGFNAAVPKDEIELSDRNYRIRRMGHGMTYNRKRVNNEVNHETIREDSGPAIAQRIGLALDGMHLSEIMLGQGVDDENESRAVTVRSVPAGEKWDTDDSQFLDEIEEAAEDVRHTANAMHVSEEDAFDDDVDTVAVFGNEVIRRVKKTAPVQEAFHGGDQARIPKRDIAGFIEDQTGVDLVIIGNKGYQDGSVHQEYEAARLHSDVAFVTVEGNIGIIPYADEDQVAGDGGPDIRVIEKEDPPVDDVIGDLYLDLITYFPDASRAFTDKWS